MYSSVRSICMWMEKKYSWSSGEFVARRIQSGPRFVAHSNVVLYKYVDYTPICILWAKLWAMIRFSGSRATPASTSSWFLRLMKKSKRWYNDGQKGTGSALDTWTAFILIDGRTLFGSTGDNTKSRPELAQLQRRIEWELVQRLVSPKSHPVVHRGNVIGLVWFGVNCLLLNPGIYLRMDGGLEREVPLDLRETGRLRSTCTRTSTQLCFVQLQTIVALPMLHAIPLQSSLI